MSNMTIWLSPAIAALICCFYHLFVSAKVKHLTQYLQHSSKKIDEQTGIIAEKKNYISTLEAKIVLLEKEKQKPKDSRELVDFMQDLKTNGYGVVRIDPDSVFYRGTR